VLTDHSLADSLIRITVPMELLNNNSSDIVDFETFECELCTQCLDCADADI